MHSPQSGNTQTEVYIQIMTTTRKISLSDCPQKTPGYFQWLVGCVCPEARLTRSIMPQIGSVLLLGLYLIVKYWGK